MQQKTSELTYEELKKRNDELEFFIREYIIGEGDKDDYVRWAIKLTQEPLPQSPQIKI